MALFKKEPHLLQSKNCHQILQKCLSHKHYAKHETIMAQGDVGREYVMLINGFVYVLNKKDKKI